MTKTLLAVSLLAAPALAAKGVDSARIEQVTGLKGQWTGKEGVFKVAEAVHGAGATEAKR
jgi:hypothetical protein